MSRNYEPTTAVARRAEGGVTRWSPWEELTDLRHRMDELFSRAFGYTPLSRLIPGEAVDIEPDVDIYETDTAVMALAAIPGFEPKEINIEATPESITITGERKPMYEDEKAVSHRLSGFAGKCSIKFLYTLPCEIDPNKVKATFRNGILQLEMPKTEAARTKAVKIHVQGT